MESENVQSAPMPVDQAGDTIESPASAVAPSKKKSSKIKMLMIAIVVVAGVLLLVSPFLLGALFALGAFSGPQSANSCIGNAGVLCTKAAYSASSGVLSFTFGQVTGQVWNQVKFAFAPANATLTNSTISSLFGAGNTNPVLNTLASGETQNVTIFIGKTSKGSTISGYIVAMYQTNETTTPEYDSVATMVLRAS
jgi:hypothetical protein